MAEDVAQLEKEIARLAERKRQADLHVISLEARIHAVERAYYRDAAGVGALFSPAGLDGYLGVAPGASGGRGRSGAARGVPDESEMVFSRTSATYQKALAAHARLVREGVLPAIRLEDGSLMDAGAQGGAQAARASTKRAAPRAQSPGSGDDSDYGDGPAPRRSPSRKSASRKAHSRRSRAQRSPSRADRAPAPESSSRVRSRPR